MKNIAITIIALLLMGALSLPAYSQEKETLSKSLPSLKMLPKSGEKKKIYELPKKQVYKIYDNMGELKSEGNAQFIDITNYKKGNYFIQYNGRTLKIEKN